MVTTYNKKDMVSFGNYLLSQERIELYKSHPLADKLPPLEQRLANVNEADFDHWMKKKEGKKFVFDLDAFSKMPKSVQKPLKELFKFLDDKEAHPIHKAEVVQQLIKDFKQFDTLTEQRELNLPNNPL